MGEPSPPSTENPDPISARFVWGPDEMAEALASQRREAFRPILKTFLLLLSAPFLIAFFGFPIFVAIQATTPLWARRNAVIFVLLSGCSAIWAVAADRRNLFLKWKARRIFRSAPNLSGLVEWSFGQDEIVVRTPVAMSSIIWPAYVKMAETPRGFLLYQSLQFFNWIPGHAFRSAEEMGRFASLARSRVAKYRLIGTCQYIGKPGSAVPDEL